MNDNAVYRDVEHAIAMAFAPVSPDTKNMWTPIGGGGLTKRDFIVQNAMVRGLALRECEPEEIRVFHLRYGNAFEVLQATQALVLAYRPKPLSFRVAQQVVEAWAVTGNRSSAPGRRHKSLSEWSQELGVPYGTLKDQTMRMREAVNDIWQRGRGRMEDLLRERELI